MNTNMSLDLIRAWKDEDYRESLNPEQLVQLSQNPAGAVELTDEELASADGGTDPISIGLSAIVSGLLTYYITRHMF
jgi:mersacidin/lichenicidin family type 2 lantibiotic